MSKYKTMNFEKFITDICEREEKSRKKIKEHLGGQEDLPQRKHNKLYRERWQNSIRYKRKIK